MAAVTHCRDTGTRCLALKDCHGEKTARALGPTVLPALPSMDQNPDGSSQAMGSTAGLPPLVPSQCKMHAAAPFLCLTFPVPGIKILEVAFSAWLTRLKSILLSLAEK